MNYYRLTISKKEQPLMIQYLFAKSIAQLKRRKTFKDCLNRFPEHTGYEIVKVDSFKLTPIIF